MSFTCRRCGGYSEGSGRSGRRSCGLCGADRYRRSRPLLVVTGAAGVGKSTLCATISAEVEGTVGLDVDAFAGGSSAALARDFVAFWAYLITLTGEIHENDLDVVWCGVCLPEQLRRQPADALAAFSAVQMLVLTCADDAYRQRRLARPGGRTDTDERTQFHRSLNRELRAARTFGSIGITQLDSTGQSVAETQAAGRAWLASVT